MNTLEEQYQKDLDKVKKEHPPKSQARENAKKGLWDKFQAARFLRDGRGGDLDVIYRAQATLATDLYNLIDDFYSGKVPAGSYEARTTAIFREYCVRMVALGLATRVPNNVWIAPYAADGIALELSLLPAKTTGFTKEDADLLCIPCRSKCTEFLGAFHSEFGVGRLKETPDVYGGIVTNLKDAEQSRTASLASMATIKEPKTPVRRIG